MYYRKSNDTMNRSSRRYLVQRLVMLLTSFLLALGLVPMVTLTTHASSNQTSSTFRPWNPPPDVNMTPGKAPAAVLRVPEEFATIQVSIMKQLSCVRHT